MLLPLKWEQNSSVYCLLTVYWLFLSQWASPLSSEMKSHKTERISDLRSVINTDVVLAIRFCFWSRVSLNPLKSCSSLQTDHVDKSRAMDPDQDLSLNLDQELWESEPEQLNEAGVRTVGDWSKRVCSQEINCCCCLFLSCCDSVLDFIRSEVRSSLCLVSVLDALREDLVKSSEEVHTQRVWCPGSDSALMMQTWTWSDRNTDEPEASKQSVTDQLHPEDVFCPMKSWSHPPTPPVCESSSWTDGQMCDRCLWGSSVSVAAFTVTCCLLFSGFQVSVKSTQSPWQH